MARNVKTESIPLLENTHYELNDASDYSSSSIHYSTDYGTYLPDTPRNKDVRNIIESVSERYTSLPDNQTNCTNELFDLKRIVLSWSDINCYVPELGKGLFGRVTETGLFKQLLFDVSGVVRSGQLLAIMGASGAGKSTLLNIITCRNLGNLKVDGDVKVNGVSMHSNIKSLSAYVQQMDVFWGRLKVREHLIYNAVLRMGKAFTKEEQIHRVDQLITEMGLTTCANDHINTPSTKVQGLAGSEKKLLSIACELLVDPPILFLDEPTTGLDSKMAEKVVKILQKLSRKGKCVICTIHQPSSHIFELFNQTCLLAEGRLVFHGIRDSALDFFGDVGFPCGENYNPADHFIHTMAIRPGQEVDCRAKVIYMSRKFRDTSEYGFLRKEILAINNASNDGGNQDLSLKLKSMSAYKASYVDEIKIQTWKQILDQVRDPKLFVSRMVQNLIIVVILAVFYYQQKYNQLGVNNISGVLFNVITNVTFLAVLQLNSFVSELNFFYREHHNGMCRSGSFFIAKNIAEMPIFLITTGTLVIVVYWSVGLYPGAEEFFIFCMVVVLIYQYSFSLNVLFIGPVFNRTDLVLNIAPLIRIVMMYMGGFLINEVSIPNYLQWLKYLSWHRYGFQIMIINQWEKVDSIQCEFDNKASCYKSGKDIINFWSFGNSNIWFDVILLLGLCIVFRVLGLLVIMLRAKERKLN